MLIWDMYVCLLRIIFIEFGQMFAFINNQSKKPVNNEFLLNAILWTNMTIT